MKSRRPVRPRERGVVLLFTLIILLIMTIGAVALIRSMSSSLFSAGNLAFRRDLANQGELAISNVMTSVLAGTFVSPTTADLASANYFAETQALGVNSQGVPNLLLNDTAFAAVATAGDLPGATPDIAIRYMIERLCIPGTVLSTSATCVQSTAAPTGGTAPGTGVPPPTATVYRVSVRVSGARNTQVFLQSTFTMPN